MLRATIKLFKFNPDKKEYWARVVSKIGDKTFDVHDSNGIPHFMRFRTNEVAIDLRHGNIPTNEGKVLAVEGILRPTVKGFNLMNGNSVLIDQSIHVKWIPAKEISETTPLDGSYTDARGYKYFASTRAATEWIYSVLMPVCQKANEFLEEDAVDSLVNKEIEETKLDRLYSAANGDNYGEEFDVPVIRHNPNTWWASLSKQERFKIYQEHAGDK